MRIYMSPEIEIEEISVVDVMMASGSPKPGSGELPGRPIAASLGTSENGGDSADVTSVGDAFGNL